MNAAEDDRTGEHGEYHPHHPRLDAERLLHRECNCVRLHRNINQTKGHRDEHSKELCHRRLPERILDIVCRPAVKESVSTRDLVDLGERALDESSCRSDECNDPHPEHGTGPARDNRNRNPRNVADTDARSSADAECLKRRNRLAPARTAPEISREQTHHLRQCPQLNKTGRESKPEPAADKHDDDDISPQEIIDRADHRIEKIHKNTLPIKNRPHNNGEECALSNCIPVFFPISGVSRRILQPILYFSRKRV